MKATIEQITRTNPEINRGIIELHEHYYCRQLGWPPSFAREVGEYLDAFSSQLQLAGNGLWIVKADKTVSGSIAIDGQDQDRGTARLRLFIVAPSRHHHGLGRRLLHRALAFCRAASYEKILLWTFDNLSAAKALYLKNNFEMREEREVFYWGCRQREQCLGLDLHRERECVARMKGNEIREHDPHPPNRLTNSTNTPTRTRDIESYHRDLKS